MDRENLNKETARLIAKAWSDPEFKAGLLANPAETLQAEGIEVPTGATVTALENTKEQLIVVIPAKPDELSDEQLQMVSGGKYLPTPCSAACYCEEIEDVETFLETYKKESGMNDKQWEEFLKWLYS